MRTEDGAGDCHQGLIQIEEKNMHQHRTNRFRVNIITSSGCALIVLFVVTKSSQTVQASWAYVPQEIRMAEADLIVAGKIEKLGKDIRKNGAVYEVGIIKASKILKGNSKLTGDIRLAWPKRTSGGLRLSTDLATPKIGEESIWVLHFNAQFSEEAHFYKAQFSGKATFINTQFSDRANFNEAQFIGVSFFQTIFGGETDFRYVRVYGALELEEANYKGNVDLRNATIKKLVLKESSLVNSIDVPFDFRDATITEAHFEELQFTQKINFSDVVFGVDVDFVGPLQLDKQSPATVFRTVTFVSDANFTRAKFYGDGF